MAQNSKKVPKNGNGNGNGKVKAYRHEEAKRKNNPPAKIAVGMCQEPISRKPSAAARRIPAALACAIPGKAKHTRAAPIMNPNYETAAI